jgi:predicted phosphohydrolase
MLHKIRVVTMTSEFICKHCHKLKSAKIRLKGNQEYCSDPECQRARKALWQKNKMTNDPQYQAQQIECIRKWRKKRPLDNYQKQYRQEHPEYVNRNRELQRIRNSKRANQLEYRKIVKMDNIEILLLL